MNKFLPILSWLPSYNKSSLVGDLSAGITVGIMLVPQGMAYAMLAGLPPIYGLYAATVPLLIYAILGTSRQLAVGPVAMVSLLVASGVGALAEHGTTEFVSLCLLLAMMVGLIQLIMGLGRLGFLVNFLSHPVIAGFTSAAALIIGFSQLKHLLGLDIPRAKIHKIIVSVFENIGQVNVPTLLIGIGGIVTILSLKRVNKRLPSPLIVVVLGLAVVSFLGLDSKGVDLVREVPSGLPAFAIPVFSTDMIMSLLPIALTIALISYVESYAVAKAIQNKHKDYELDPNQELIGLGAANIFGSLFSAFPVTGGFSRSAVNDQAGAKTGIAAIISAALVVLALMFLTPYFYNLPKAVLAAIIMVAVFGLIDFKEAVHLWKTDRYDFLAFAITFLATLFVGIEQGILIGIAVSLAVILYKISYPHVAELEQIPMSPTFRNIERFENLVSNKEAIILRYDAPLFFANCASFKEKILSKITERPEAKRVVLDVSGISHVDSSAIHILKDLHKILKDKKILLQFADVKGPIRDLFQRNGLHDKFGKDNFFLSVKDAADSSETKVISFQQEFLFQTNTSQLN